MYTEGFEQWFKLNRNLAAPLNEWNRAATEISSRLMRQNIELMGENFTLISDQFKRFGSVKNTEELFSLQRECFNEDVSAAIASLQKIMQSTIENLEDFTKLLATSVEHQAATINKAADRGKERYEREKERSK